MINSKVLTRRELETALKQTPPLVESLVDPKVQLQQNGVELTLRDIFEFRSEEAGAIAFDNSKRRVVEGRQLKFDEFGWVKLKRNAYRVIFNEIVNIPRNVFALARPRSSLLRNGVTVETALWDSGYSGRSESLLIVHAPGGCMFEKNARLIQLIFFWQSKGVEAEYTGRYVGENTMEQLGFDRLIDE
jgi:dUTP pyrophosphatase